MTKSLLLLFTLVSWAGMAQNGTVLSYKKISDTTANFTGVLANDVNFGTGVAAIGDLNGDGVTELVVGAYDVGGKGAVYTLFMNTDGSIDSFKLITEGQGGFTGTLGNGNRFGYSVALIGDLDQDGVPDIVASSELDDDGGSDRGAVWILYLKADGTVKSHAKISSTTQGSLLGAPSYGIGNTDRFGSEVAGIGDLDGDGIPDIAASAIFDDDGGNNRGAVWIIFLNRNGSIKNFQKISATQGGFTGTLSNFSFWGSGLANIGDLDGDGVQDLVVGQELENANGTYKGAIWILFMNTNGTVKSHREIRNGLTGTGLPAIANNSYFGSACAGLGDIDGDGIPDIAIGANGTDSQRGAVWILMLNANGTIKASQKISYNTPNATVPLDVNDLFGNSVTSLGDLNGDGKIDIAVGAAFDDDGGPDKGAVYILNLQGVAACTKAAFTASNSHICLGDTVFFTSTSTGATSYIWKNNGVAFSTAADTSFTPTTAGSYTIRLVTTDGVCTDSVEQVISVAAPSGSSYTTQACQGQSRYIAGTWQTVAGTYYDTLTNAAGCDSVVTILFILNPISQVTRDTVAICLGDSYLGNTQAGLYSDTFYIGGQCRVDVLDLRVLQGGTSNRAQAICHGDSVWIGGAWRFAAGSFNDTLTNQSSNGCDSIVTVALSVLQHSASLQNITICPGQSYFAGGATQTTAGTYLDTLTTANGCDSVRTTVLTLSTTIRDTIAQTVCEGTVVAGYNATGVYLDTFATANGCDSIRLLNLTVIPTFRTTDVVTICFGGSHLGYNTTGTYQDTMVDLATGCLRILTTNLTVRPANTSTVTQTICQGQSFEGYTATGVYTDVFSDLNGCDSTRTLNLTVDATINTSETHTVCFGDSYQGFTTTGIYRDTLPSSGGCDSIHTLNLTVLPQNTYAISPVICQGQSFMGYTATGSYVDTLTDANGCDSILSIRLLVNNAIETLNTVAICTGDSYEGQSVTGIYSDTFSTAAGCDSIYTLDLTVVPYPIVPSITASNNVLAIEDTFASYQWYHDGTILTGEEADTLTAATNGNYTVVVTNAAGCADTSATFNFTGIGIGEVAASIGVLVYPNPSEGVFNIMVEGNMVGQFTVEVYNTLGEKLLHQPLKSNTTALNISVYAVGVYWVKISNGTEVYTTRVLKQ